MRMQEKTHIPGIQKCIIVCLGVKTENGIIEKRQLSHKNSCPIISNLRFPINHRFWVIIFSLGIGYTLRQSLRTW